MTIRWNVRTEAEYCLLFGNPALQESDADEQTLQLRRRMSVRHAHKWARGIDQVLASSDEDLISLASYSARMLDLVLASCPDAEEIRQILEPALGRLREHLGLGDRDLDALRAQLASRSGEGLMLSGPEEHEAHELDT
jgi:hypothetical protein